MLTTRQFARPRLTLRPPTDILKNLDRGSSIGNHLATVSDLLANGSVAFDANSLVLAFDHGSVVFQQLFMQLLIPSKSALPPFRFDQCSVFECQIRLSLRHLDGIAGLSDGHTKTIPNFRELLLFGIGWASCTIT